MVHRLIVHILLIRVLLRLVATNPRVKIHTVPAVVRSMYAQPIVTQPAMSIKDLKILGKFLRFSPSIFAGALGGKHLSFLMLVRIGFMV